MRAVKVTTSSSLKSFLFRSLGNQKRRSRRHPLLSSSSNDISATANTSQRRQTMREEVTNRMPASVKKENLPEKVCVVCNRPFTWRKKWERCWDEVTTCSKSCNAKRKREKQQQRGGEEKEGEQQQTMIQTTKSEEGNKLCDKCGKSRAMLIRCQIDSGKRWNMICVEGCWRSVSGGVTDGTAEFPHYKYGGVWKNRRKVSLEEKRKAPPVVGAVLGE